MKVFSQESYKVMIFFNPFLRKRQIFCSIQAAIKRSPTIERVFADAKEKHGMRYTQYRGIKKVRMELNLLFACMNLRKLAIWLDLLGLTPTDPSPKTRKKSNIILKFYFRDIIVAQCSKIVRGFCNLRTILSTV